MQIVFPIALVLIANLLVEVSTSEDAIDGQFPHQVLVTVGGEGICSGSLICDRAVLTSAICLQGFSDLKIGVGSVNISAVKEFGVKEARKHFDFDSCNYNNAIGLIILSEAVQLNNFVQPIALATDHIPSNVSVTVAGWETSQTCPPVQSKKLTAGQVETLDEQQCQEAFGPELAPPSVLCLKGKTIPSGCEGNPGSPVIEYRKGKAVQVAIASYPATTCERNGPRGSVRIAPYMDWILSEINGVCELVKY